MPSSVPAAGDASSASAGAKGQYPSTSATSPGGAPTHYPSTAPRIFVDGWDLSLGYGSFFHEMRIDGELVAVSVLDVLPTRVASVYFFYNPDFRYLELGKLSALIECYLAHALFRYTTRHAQTVLGWPTTPSSSSGTDTMASAAVASSSVGHVTATATITGPSAALPPMPSMLRYLDLNFYVHACPAMNYKRNFVPSELLCPIAGSHHWVPLTKELLFKLDADPCPPIAVVDDPDDPGNLTNDADAVWTVAMGDMAVEMEEAERLLPTLLCSLNPSQLVLYDGITPAGKALIESGFRKFAHLAGPHLAARTVLDPNWVAHIATQAKRAQEKNDAKKALLVGAKRT